MSLVLGVLWPCASVGFAGATDATDTAPECTFVANEGQWPESVRYLGRIGPTVVRAEAGAILLQQGAAEGVLVRIGLGNTLAVPSGESRLETAFHYILGNDPRAWVFDASGFNRVCYRDAWPGIDLLVGGVGESLVLELISRDPAVREVRLEWQGTERADRGDLGEVLLRTERGSFSVRGRWRGGSAYSHYVAWSSNDSGVVIASRSETPVESGPGRVSPPSDLLFSTLLGAVDGIGETAVGVGRDPRGNLVVGGWTDGVTFPTTPGVFEAPGIDRNLIVSKISPEKGTLVFSTVLGGRRHDQALDFTVDESGRGIVVGTTDSPNFPTTPGAFDSEYGAATGLAFVLRLSADGKALELSSFLGNGPGGAIANAVAARSDGSIAIGGRVSPDAQFPVTEGALHTGPQQSSDGFVTVFSPDGSALVWSTFLGGSSAEEVSGLCTLPDDSVVAVGWTASDDFPVTLGAYDVQKADGRDAFVSRLTSEGSSLHWSTFLGGKNDDMANTVDADAFGRVFVAGDTQSPNFPTTPDAFDSLWEPDWEGFVSCLQADGSALSFSTLLGGVFEDRLSGIGVDASGICTVAGRSFSFPTTEGAWSESPPGGGDGLIARLDSDGSRLLYATFLGGSGLDGVRGLALLPEGAGAFASGVSSLDFPTTPTAPFQSYAGGQTDLALSVLGLLPVGVERVGSSGSSCLGDVVIYPAAQPVSGSSAFGFRVSGAPPSTAGAFSVGLASLTEPLPLGQAKFWLDPLSPFWSIPVVTDSTGYAKLDLPLGAGLEGAVFYAQALFLSTSACPLQGVLTASGALRLVVQ